MFRYGSRSLNTLLTRGRFNTAVHEPHFATNNLKCTVLSKDRFNQKQFHAYLKYQPKLARCIVPKQFVLACSLQSENFSGV